MVEQDYLISQAVAAIFTDKFLRSQVAMRGGTVLHKGHLAPACRYSEDIDLVLVGARPASHIKKAVARVLEPILGVPSESVLTDIRLAVRNIASKSKIIRTTYIYDPRSPEAALAHLKIEVNVNEKKSLFPMARIDVGVPDGSGGLRSVPVVSYDLDEMLGTKLRALMQREHGRDLFDLWWACEMSKSPSAKAKVNPARVCAAFRFYMRQEKTVFTAAAVRAELERRMQSRKFLSDMAGYLSAGRSYLPQTAYADFCEAFLPHIES